MTKSNQKCDSKCDSNCDSFEKNRFLKAIKINMIAINGRDPLVPTIKKPPFMVVFFVLNIAFFVDSNSKIWG